MENTLSCGDVLSDYLMEHVERKVVDVRRQRIAIIHLMMHFNQISVSAVTPGIIDEYCFQRSNGYIGRPSKDPTQRRELGVLRAAINHAVRHRRMPAGEAPYIPLPSASPPRDRWLSRSELAKLFAGARSHNFFKLSRLYKFIALAYYTGSRRSALENLTWDQVDLENKRIKLARNGEHRTKKRRPTVPISPALMPMLERAYKERTSDYVLDYPSSTFDGFKELVKEIGLSDVTPHTLRHTRAVHLAQDGVSLYDIAGLLGNSIATVEQNYLHHCPDHLAAVLESDARIGATLHKDIE